MLRCTLVKMNAGRTVGLTREIQHHSSARKGGTGSAHSCIKLCPTEISLHVFIITTTTTLGVPQHPRTQETMWTWVASQKPKGTMRIPLSSSSPPHQKSVMMISKKIRLVLKTFKMVRKPEMLMQISCIAIKVASRFLFNYFHSH